MTNITPKNRDELIEFRARVICRTEEECEALNRYSDEASRERYLQDVEDGYWREHIATARAIIEAEEAAGLHVMPVEATEEMEEAADEPFHTCVQQGFHKIPRGWASLDASRPMYRAMLAASPFIEHKEPAK